MMKITRAFAMIGELAGVLNVTKINELPGLWEHQIDDLWLIKVNGHDKEVEHVPPFSAYITFNGWPAGVIDPFGGCIVASDHCNEDSFISAIGAAIERAKA